MSESRSVCPSASHVRTSGGGTVVVAVGIFLFAVAAWAVRFYDFAATPASSEAPSGASAEPAPARLSPIELAALRRKAWDLIEPRLDEADQASQAALDEQLLGVEAFFAARAAGAQPFAEAVLSLRGKWEFAKSKLPTAADDAHLRFINDKFEAHIFRIDDLKATLEHAVGGYVSRVRGLEGKLLVDVRADLSDGEFAAAELSQSFASDAVMRSEFERLLKETAAATSADFQVAMSREVTSFAAGEIGAVIAVRVATAVAARLGVSAGVLGTGAASSWATFGLGLAAAVAVDVALTKVIELAGYDPVHVVTEKVQTAVAQIGSLIVDGNAEARDAYAKLRTMQDEDPDETVRKACRRAADSIEQSGNLGLRRELRRLHEQRAQLRRAALKRLVLEPAEAI